MLRDKSGWPQLAIRPVVGVGLIYHAGPMLLTRPGHDNFVHMLKQVGVPWPEPTAVLVAGLELAGGVAVLIGAFTVLASLLVALEMLTRIIGCYLLRHGHPTPLPGQPPLLTYETTLLYIGLLLALVAAGGGRYSIDRWWLQMSAPLSTFGYWSLGNQVTVKRWNEVAPLPVRLVVGGGLACHGYPKLFTADGHANCLHLMQEAGIPFPELASWLVAILEFWGGLALVFGAIVVTVAVLVSIEIVINIVVALVHHGFPPPLNPAQPLPGYEQSFLYLAGALALVIGGSGGWSITRMFVPKPTR